MEQLIENIGVALPLLISPLEGEMPGRAEGVASGGTAKASSTSSATPPGGFAATLPSRGREGAFTITAEAPSDIAAREALLDRAMGVLRRRKSSEKLRRGRLPSPGLAFVARDAAGDVVGTVRLWDVAFERAFSLLDGGTKDGPRPVARARAAGRSEGVVSEGTAKAPRISSATPSAAFGGTSPSRGEGRALLLGPLAVEPSLKGAGVGSALMRHAIAAAESLGHRAILLVGDAPYYARFGFSAEKTGSLAMPGPYERHRFLALELAEGALDGASGVLKAAGRRQRSAGLETAA